MNEKLLVNRYRVIKKLGEGGMGIVWKVYDTLENREVALKQFFRAGTSARAVPSKAAVGIGAVTKAGLDPSATITCRLTLSAGQAQRVILTTTEETKDEESLRFKQEFRTMVKLQHPNTVQVYDYGVLENGDDYLTMEIVPGQELRDILKERQLTIPEVYRILIQFAQVINFIHSRLFVHRDIKPDNIRILADGNIKVMDFGLIEQMGLPSSGGITGTPLYLPPEVAKGGIIDARSDLYSLGIMAYELTTGKLPFMADSILDIIKKHIEEEPVPPKKIKKGIPEELERAILKLIAKEPDRRYQTTAELIDDLVKISGWAETVESLAQRKSYLNCSELVGRDKEMQSLKKVFGLIKQGKRQSFFIGAPAGTGKSRLVQEFQLHVQLDEVPFTQGRCFEQGMGAYRPLAEALRSLLPLTKKAVLDKYGSVLVKVIPELIEKGYKPAPLLDEFGEKTRLFGSIIGWLQEVSKVSPLVIYIEDLHWSDIVSIELLNNCIRGLNNSRILFITTFRDDEVEPNSAIYHTVEEGLTQIMKLTPLNLPHVEVLIRKMLGRSELTDEFTEHIFNATGGNPFFVSEIMRSLIEEEQLKLDRGRWILPADISTLKLPTSIEATTTRRLRLVSPDALQIARIAAVVGRGLDLTFLKSLSGVEEEKLFDSIDELIERQFMQTEEKQYLFTHDRVRETLYAQLEEKTRKQLHERAGAIIETRFAKNKEPVINELAYHFSCGLNKAKAVEYLILAGDSKKKINDIVASTKLWAEALEILDTIDYPNKKTVIFHVRDKLLDTSYAGNPEVCSVMCERQFNELNSLGNILRIVKLIRAIFKIVDMLPKRIAIRIKEKLSKQPPKERIERDFSSIVRFMVRSHGYGALAEFFIGNTRKALEIIERCDQYLPDFNGPTYSQVQAGFCAVLCYTGRTKTYKERQKHALDILETMKRYGCLQDPFDKYIYGSEFFMGNLPYSVLAKKIDKDFQERGLRYCEKENYLDLIWWYYCLHWEWLSYRGMYQEFQKESDRAKMLSRKLGRPPTQEVWYFCYLTRIEVLLNNYENAKESVDKLYILGKQASSSYLTIMAEMYKALLVFRQGEEEEGISRMEKTVELATELNFVFAPEAMVTLAEMYLDLEEIEQAQSFLLKAEEFLSKKLEEPNLVSKARVYLLNSEIMRRKKELEKAQSTLNGVLKIAEETDNPLLRGWFNVEMAKIYTDLTQWSSAKNSLFEAQKIFDKIGAENKKREVEELLRSIRD